MFLKFLTPFKNFAMSALESMPKSDIETGSGQQPSIRQLAIDECTAVAGGPQVRNDTEM